MSYSTRGVVVRRGCGLILKGSGLLCELVPELLI